MAELSTQDADRAIVASPAAQLLRKKFATYLQLAKMETPKLRGGVPSYVVIAIDALFAAWERWEQDEKEINHAS